MAVKADTLKIIAIGYSLYYSFFVACLFFYTCKRPKADFFWLSLFQCSPFSLNVLISMSSALGSQLAAHSSQLLHYHLVVYIK
jgi:hypothetical protein